LHTAPEQKKFPVPAYLNYLVSGNKFSVAGDKTIVARKYDAVAGDKIFVARKFDSVAGDSIFFNKFFLVCTVGTFKTSIKIRKSYLLYC
jgi:hypothetical protein